MNNLTFQQVQQWQRELNPHPEPVDTYAEPFGTLGSILSMSRAYELRDLETETGKMQRLIGAAILVLADYCEAKHWDLSTIMCQLMEAMEQRKKDFIQEQKNVQP